MKMKRLLAAVLSATMLFGSLMVADAAEPSRQITITPVYAEDHSKVDLNVTFTDVAVGDYAVIYLTANEIARDHDLSDGYSYSLTMDDFIKCYGWGPDVFGFTVELHDANHEVKASRSYFETIKVYDGGMHRWKTKKNYSTSGLGAFGGFNDGVAKLVNNYDKLKVLKDASINGSCNSRARIDANGNLVIDTCEWLGFNYSGATALKQTKTPVTVIFTYADTLYQFVIPAGFDVESYLDKDGNVGFLYLSEQLGRYQLVNGTPVLVIPPKANLEVQPQ